MNALIRLAEAWWPLYAVHFIEVSLFILLVWAVDRWMTLDTRLRYVLYLLALAKAFVPPVLAIPIPAFLVSSTNVTVNEPVYSGVVSEAIAVSPVQVATLPPAFYLFCLWILSVLVWAGVALWKNAALRRTLKSATPVELASKAEAPKLPCNLTVFSRSGLPSPILVGVLRPRLYLPSNWASWSPEQLRGVVAHELAHRDNRDIYTLIFQAIAMALFGLNPLIWLVNRKLIYLRELRCDEAVLRQTNLTPAEYGKLLFGFVDRRPALSALTLYFNERGTALKERLEHILNFKEADVKRSGWQLAIPILIGLAILPFSIREAYTQPPQTAPKAEPTPASGDADSSAVTEFEKKPEHTPKQQAAPPDSGDADGVSVREFWEVETKPVVTHRVRPVYPEEARGENLEGKVFLRFKVNVDGSVSDVKVLKGQAIFHKAAVEAVSQCRFKPAQHKGKAVPVWMTQPITFPLPKQQAAPPDSGEAGGGEVLEFQSSERQTSPTPSPAPHTVGVGRRNLRSFWGVDVKPVATYTVSPEYPDLARKAGLVGHALMKFTVNVDGSVSDITYFQGQAIFKEAAIDAISQFRFKPAVHEGKVVPVWMLYSIDFKLPDQQMARPDESGDDGSGANNGRAVRELWAVDVQPIVVQTVPPILPDLARRTGLFGSVILKFLVNEDGSVSDVTVLQGQEIFQKPAIDAVLKWRFTPAKHNGKAVPVWLTRRIPFRSPDQNTGPLQQSGVGDGNGVALKHNKVDETPVLVHSVPPIYPDKARKAGLTGKVLLKFKVNVDGSVSDVSIMKGPRLLRKPAIEAVSQFFFKPGEHRGKVVPVWMNQWVLFQLPRE